MILCEDARQDTNKKFILIGVFSEDILVSELPGQVPLQFYLEIKSMEAGEYSLSVRLSGPSDDSVVLKALISFEEPGRITTLISPRMEIVFKQRGVFKVDASLDDENWVNLIAKNVFEGNPSDWQRPSEQSPSDVPASS